MFGQAGSRRAWRQHLALPAQQVKFATAVLRRCGGWQNIRPRRYPVCFTPPQCQTRSAQAANLANRAEMSGAPLNAQLAAGRFVVLRRSLVGNLEFPIVSSNCWGAHMLPLAPLL
jgi:hypothetical protein